MGREGKVGMWMKVFFRVCWIYVLVSFILNPRAFDVWADHSPDVILGPLMFAYIERKLECMGLIEKEFTEI